MSGIRTHPIGDQNSDRLLQEQLRLLLSDAVTSLAINVSAVVLAVAILYAQLQSDLIHVWIGGAVVALLLRAIFCLALSHVKFQASLTRQHWTSIYLFLIGVSGVMWGSLALFWTPELANSAQLQLFLFPVAMAAGAVSAFGAWLPAFFTFLLPCLIPVIGVLLFGNSTGYVMTTLPALAFLVGLMLLGTRYQARVKETILLKFANDELVENLSNQNDLLRVSMEQAETADKVKSEFLARISHELRTPMNGVLGMTQVLESTQLSAQQQKVAHNIQTSAQSLLDLIDDVLDISEISAEGLQLAESEFSTERLVMDLVVPFEDVIKEKGLELFSEIDADVPTTLHGDYSRLKQILRNLISNAVKFTDRGSIILSVKVQQQYGSRNELVFCVADSGAGIGLEHQRIIFESFSQADNTSTRQHQGAGLGLTVAHKLAEMMSANLQVESELGQGSAFSLTIWLDHGQEAVNLQEEGRASEVTENLLVGIRILLVEDCEINQAVAKVLLENTGCIVTVAWNGAEAIALVKVSEFDLVLMDCQMPVMDGYEATQAIRKMEKKKDIKIVALTANAMKGDREKCLDAGMDEYLSKPFKAEELKKLISDLVGVATTTLVTSDIHRRNNIVAIENSKNVLDSATLDNLRMLDKGKGLICRVIDAFSNSMPGLMSDLQTGIDEQDAEKISMPAHTMKSSSANMGALAFSKQCAVIETLARKGDLAPIASEYELLQELLKPVVVELEQERQAAEARKVA